MRFIQYQVKWKDGEGQENDVEFWLKGGVDVHTMMWPLLNLAELDAADEGYKVDVENINSINIQVTQK